jgi:hypothetical protein
MIFLGDFAPLLGLLSAPLLAPGRDGMATRKIMLPKAPLMHPNDYTGTYGGYDVESA